MGSNGGRVGKLALLPTLELILAKIKNKRQLIEDSGFWAIAKRIAIISTIHQMLVCQFQLRMRKIAPGGHF